jgi:hypothetical protein
MSLCVDVFVCRCLCVWMSLFVDVFVCGCHCVWMSLCVEFIVWGCLCVWMSLCVDAFVCRCHCVCTSLCVDVIVCEYVCVLMSLCVDVILCRCLCVWISLCVDVIVCGYPCVWMTLLDFTMIGQWMPVLQDKIRFVPKQLYMNYSNLSTIWNSKQVRAGSLVTPKQISFSATKPPGDPEDGDGVTYRNCDETSHPDAVVCLIWLHWILGRESFKTYFATAYDEGGWLQ